jgi:hypothetical protein
MPIQHGYRVSDCFCCCLDMSVPGHGQLLVRLNGRTHYSVVPLAKTVQSLASWTFGFNISESCPKLRIVVEQSLQYSHCRNTLED